MTKLHATYTAAPNTNIRPLLSLFLSLSRPTIVIPLLFRWKLNCKTLQFLCFLSLQTHPDPRQPSFSVNSLSRKADGNFPAIFRIHCHSKWYPQKILIGWWSTAWSTISLFLMQISLFRLPAFRGPYKTQMVPRMSG